MLIKLYRILKCAALLLALFPCVAHGQEATEEPKNKLTLDVDLLTRGEIRRGGLANEDDDPSENIAKFIVERTRLGLDFERDFLKAHIMAQHSSVWGEAGKGSINLYEAWAQLTAKNGLFAKVGRQVLSYDDERIIGSDDWTVTALSHDVLKLGYEGYGHKAHAIFAYNQNGESVDGGTRYVDGDKPYKMMQTLWYHYDFQKIPLGASLLFMNLCIQGGNPVDTIAEYNQQLLGGYVSFTPDKWTVEGSYYRQFGKAEQGIKLSTWMASLKASFAPTEKWKIIAGYDVLSGDPHFALGPLGQQSIIHHKVIRGFTPAYGAHHKFYGAMDFFYVTTYKDGFSPGLQNLYVGINYSPIKNMNLNATYHHYDTETHFENYNKSLGNEIELSASYKPMKEIEISLGYTYMNGSKTMEALKRVGSDRDLHWAWLNFVVRPKIFTTRW